MSAQRFTAVGPTPARRPTSTVESNSSISPLHNKSLLVFPMFFRVAQTI
jgi:hypothetical protein